MADFRTTGNVYLQPNDNMIYEFLITSCDDGKNNGYIPYGLTVSSVEAEVLNADGTDVSSYMIVGIPSVVDMTLFVNLKYSNTWGDGKYRLRFYLTLSNGKTKRARFDRLFCEDN